MRSEANLCKENRKWKSRAEKAAKQEGQACEQGSRGGIKTTALLSFVRQGGGWQKEHCISDRQTKEQLNHLCPLASVHSSNSLPVTRILGNSGVKPRLCSAFLSAPRTATLHCALWSECVAPRTAAQSAVAWWSQTEAALVLCFF